MELIYTDEDLVVCVKPAGVRATDEPGGVPELVRQALGQPEAQVRTVHRLDQVVSGLMVLARTKQAATELSRQIREQGFQKEYQAVIHGVPGESQGTVQDLLFRDKQRLMTVVVNRMDKGVQEAILDYRVLKSTQGLSRVAIRVHTGRTHQIRVQFSSRGFPLVGEKKYSTLEDDCNIALWSFRLAFTHPRTGMPMAFCKEPPQIYPWTIL